MILSHSGWRGVFAASGDGEDGTVEVGSGHLLVATGAAAVFADYLKERINGDAGRPLVLVGTDTRPTGKRIAGAIIPTLLACGCAVRYAGVVAAPEIMAWARSAGGVSGFVYVSASHNPIGHNGLKFGLADGGVLSAGEAGKLTGNFRLLMEESGIAERLQSIASGVDPASVTEVMQAEPEAKKAALESYLAFSGEVAWPGGCDGARRQLVRAVQSRPLGVCCDFNGSARSASIDRDFLGSLGIRLKAINDVPGGIAHGIVPEGEFLDPCRRFLEETHRSDPAFVLGYVPDCDGDRGNLVVWDEGGKTARPLEAQEVFALACVAELAFLARECGGRLPEGTAVAVNDPTSLRIDEIARSFGASVFRAEVGEANVVELARRLRGNGRTVRILGEGSAGGNITHPSAVRDPIHTVLAIAKLLLITGEGDAGASLPGLFELWCSASGQPGRYRADFSLADVIASLPRFSTTGASSKDALLKVAESDHSKLKRRYQDVFLREWELRRDELKALYGIRGWEATAYNGTESRKCGADGGVCDFASAGTGGLKIVLTDSDGRAAASVWMRGSATEPVFRLMADAKTAAAERDLIRWQRRMTIEADA